MSGTRALLLALPLLVVASPLAGRQAGGIRFAAAAGPTLNDFEVSGAEWMGLAGVEWRPAVRLLVVQLDVRYLSYVPAERERHILTEATVQLEGRLGPVLPFAGAGLGRSLVIREGDDASSWTAHVAVGTRVRLGPVVGLRVEARGRSLDPVGDLTAGITLGLF